ncbi:MAG TPA: HD domain-containing phosphohydrolase, partial [Thermoanaerobaculia bacterium]|nr:HD domain-containing phosphohydrolase [Thermoanaerobaculia bacterium]
LVSLVPLLVTDGILIRRNRRVLETLEEKYLTRSSAALAERISAYYAAATQQLSAAADAFRLAGHLGRKDPFTSADGLRILNGALEGSGGLLALRGVNLAGRGSFVGPDVANPRADHEFRRGFESARDGRAYAGKPFLMPELGTVAVLAAPVSGEGGLQPGVVEALVSWSGIEREFRDEAKRDARATVVDREGFVLFPIGPGSRPVQHPSLLVADFTRFPGRLTRSEDTRLGAVLASIAPVGEPPWGVLVERDRELAFASVSSMVRETLFWSAVVLAGSLLLGLLFARRLAEPIAGLARQTRAISGGQYGALVPVTGTAEIAHLSENFNKMSLSIRDAFAEVERRARENRELFINSIRALVQAIDAKDPYTRGHSERVAAYAETIAAEMGLPADEVEKVKLSGLLHDVGKIGVDDRIIRKPTALTEEEFELMKTHPVKGAAIMSAIPQLADVIPGMKYHHEKWQGGGYPEGLKGEEIPLPARIVTVADTFDAMTTTRPYQKAMEIQFVVDQIRQCAPSRFDPRIVEAFVSAWEKGRIAPIEEVSHPKPVLREAS